MVLSTVNLITQRLTLSNPEAQLFPWLLGHLLKWASQNATRSSTNSFLSSNGFTAHLHIEGE